MKKFISLILALLILFTCSASIVSCTDEKDSNEEKEGDKSEPFDLTKAYTEKTPTVDHETNCVQIEFEHGAYIVIRLYPGTAPKTVANFKKLVNEKFYDGLIFHRVIENFMIQGGDPEGTGMGGSDEEIYGEFTNNGWYNNISHERGVISMARNGYNMNSASSQFFIMHVTDTRLDGNYAAFGEVIRGIETVDAIAAVKTNEDDKPLVDIKIKTISYVEG